MPGESLAIAFALWAQGLIVFAILPVLYNRRVPRLLRGEIELRDIALDSANWPADARQASNAYSNQFELPVLFFVAGGLFLWLGATWLDAALCWLFVLTRCVHAYIHVTTNHVFSRFRAYVAGVVALVAVWLVVGVKLVSAGLA